MKRAAKLLRFHTVNPKSDSTRFMEYKDIARALGTTYNQAQHLCRHTSNVSFQTKRKRKLHKLSAG